MELPRGTSYVLPAAATAAYVLACGAAWVANRDHVAALRAMMSAPRASLAAPRAGPTIYTGRVYGPDARTTPAGRPAAASWWWVVRRNDDHTETVCASPTSDRGGMQLRAEGRAVPVTLGDTPAPVSLLAAGRDWDWSDRVVIDLGTQTETTAPGFPGPAARCAAGDRRYSELWLPQGAPAEVLACYAHGALAACDGPLAGVVALPTLRVQRQRRAVEVRATVRLAGAVLTGVLVVVGIRVLVACLGLLTALGPRRRAAS